ncbi:MAG: glycosyltransferase [Pseudomonadota bacterium]|nr:glycosyltransferase [Pseudomonadota bacterium]
MKPRILLLTGYYLPGFKSGGPVRSIVNLVESLHEYFDFYILTSDRDLGDVNHYPGIEYGIWYKIGNAMVRYLSPKEQSPMAMWRLIRQTEHELLYLNSFFSPRFTIIPLLGRKLDRILPRPVLIAPRGEFSQGALNIKSLKKNTYLSLVKITGLIRGINFHATSKLEVEDIVRNFNISKMKIFSATNLPTPPSLTLPATSRDTHGKKLHIAFLSRISKKKNLSFALDVLRSVKSRLCFNIYGPIEDSVYWKDCNRIIRKMPDNIEVVYHGVVAPEDVPAILRQHDLFFLPTLGENYGHVIAESLSAGTPVLISDLTPWRNLEYEGLGYDISLSDYDCFVRVIERFSCMSVENRAKVRIQVHASMIDLWNKSQDVEKNRKMFKDSIDDKLCRL